MDNTFTTGSEGISSGIIINEDKSMVMQVISYDSDSKIVTAKKIWDIGSTGKLFYAWNKNNSRFIIGQFVVFYRVGAFNSLPSATPAEFELKTEDAYKVSWLCISASPILMIQQAANSELGNEVKYVNGAFTPVTNSPKLQMLVSTAPGLFINSSGETGNGRVFFGQRLNDKYIVFLEGMSKEKLWNMGVTAEGTDYTFSLGMGLTSDGRVVSFDGSATAIAPPTPDPVNYAYCIADWIVRDYDGNTGATLGGSYADYPYVAIICYATTYYPILPYYNPESNTFRRYADNYTIGLYGYESSIYALDVQFKEIPGDTDPPTWGGMIYADRAWSNWHYYGDPSDSTKSAPNLGPADTRTRVGDTPTTRRSCEETFVYGTTIVGSADM